MGGSHWTTHAAVERNAYKCSSLTDEEESVLDFWNVAASCAVAKEAGAADAAVVTAEVLTTSVWIAQFGEIATVAFWCTGKAVSVVAGVAGACIGATGRISRQG